jgi:glucan phosphorylase
MPPPFTVCLKMKLSLRIIKPMSNGIAFRTWIQYIKNSVAHIAPEFTTKRMLDDYLESFYTKMYKRYQAKKVNDYKKAVDIAAWKRKVIKGGTTLKYLILRCPIFGSTNWVLATTMR